MSFEVVWTDKTLRADPASGLADIHVSAQMQLKVFIAGERFFAVRECTYEPVLGVTVAFLPASVILRLLLVGFFRCGGVGIYRVWFS